MQTKCKLSWVKRKPKKKAPRTVNKHQKLLILWKKYWKNKKTYVIIYDEVLMGKILIGDEDLPLNNSEYIV